MRYIYAHFPPVWSASVVLEFIKTYTRTQFHQASFMAPRMDDVWVSRNPGSSPTGRWGATLQWNHLGASLSSTPHPAHQGL